jgi:HEAT repeat protein
MSRLKDISIKLDSPEESDRSSGIVDLVRLGDLRAVPILKRIIGRDESLKVRYSARKALTILKDRLSNDLDKKDKRKLTQINLNSLQTLLYSESEKKRCQAVDAAVKYNDPRASNLIIKRLKTESSTLVIKSLLLGLAILLKTKSIQIIADYMSNIDADIRSGATEALSYIRHESVLPYLLVAFSDSEEKVRSEAKNTLSSLTSVQQISAFKDILINREDRVKMRALKVLFCLKESYSVSLLALALKDKSDTIVKESKSLLTKLAENKFENAQKVLSSSDFINKSPATEIIKKYTVDNEIKLKSKKPMDKIAVLHRLISENSKNKIGVIQKILKVEKEKRVLSKAIIAAGILGNSDTISFLKQFLENEDPRIRANAVEAVYRLSQAGNNINDIGFMLPMLKDNNNRVRANAITALRKDYYKESTRALKKMVSSSDIKDRISSIYVISDIIEPDDSFFLESLLMDRSPEVRNRAFDCLKIFQQKNISEANEIIISFEKKRNNISESVKSSNEMTKKNSEFSQMVQNKTIEKVNDHSNNTALSSIIICSECGFENDGWRLKCRKCKAALKKNNIQMSSNTLVKKTTSIINDRADKKNILDKRSYSVTEKKSEMNNCDSVMENNGFIKSFIKDLEQKTTFERILITSLLMFILIYLPLLIIMLVQKYIFIN